MTLRPESSMSSTHSISQTTKQARPARSYQLPTKQEIRPRTVMFVATGIQSVCPAPLLRASDRPMPERWLCGARLPLEEAKLLRAPADEARIHPKSYSKLYCPLRGALGAGSNVEQSNHRGFLHHACGFGGRCCLHRLLCW